MRGLIMLSASLLMVSCSGEEPAPEIIDFVTANGTPAGTYEVSAADGTMSIVTINADGTYSQVTPDGLNPADGTLEVIEGQTCFKVRQVGSTPLCYTETERQADGAYTATTDDGLELTVRPHVAPAEAGEDAGAAEASG